MKILRSLFCLALALCLFTSAALASAPPPPKPQPLSVPLDEYPVVDGSTATLPLSYLLVSRLTGISEEEAKDLIRHGKTTESFYALVGKTSDLLLVYQPSQDALDYAKEQGVELEIKPIGVDALVFLVNDQNPVSSLTQQQVVDIYSGKVTNWSEVGGADVPIIPYQRVEESGSQVMMRRQVMKDVPMADAPSELRPEEMGMLVDSISSYQNTADSIGYSVYYYVSRMYMKSGIKLMPIGGVPPTNETIQSGEYPYTQEFFAVIRKDAPKDSPARAIYNWLTTDAGKALIEEAGYVGT